MPGDARLVRAGVFAPRVVEALADCGNADSLAKKLRERRENKSRPRSILDRPTAWWRNRPVNKLTSNALACLRLVTTTPPRPPLAPHTGVSYQEKYCISPTNNCPQRGYL